MANRREKKPGNTRVEPAFVVLQHRDYRLLWGAEFVSTLGTQMQRVAIAWQVFQLTGDPFQLGLLGLVRFVPLLLFGLAGGVVADRGDRRRTLLATQATLMASATALAVLSARDDVTLPVIYGLTFLSATVSAVAGPTRQAFIPSLVPASRLQGAMTMNVLALQVAGVSGPAVGGILIDRVGVGAAYAVDAASFGAVILAVLAMRARPTQPTTTVRGVAAAVEGLRFLRGSPILLGVMAVDFLATFFGASTTLMPIFAEELLEIGASGLGILYAAPAVGAVVGSLVMAAAPSPRRPGAGVLIAVGVYGACLAGFGLSRVFWVSLLFLAASGAADSVSMALRHAVRNLLTPDQLRGRVAAAHSTFAMGGPQLGEFEAGALAAWTGAGPSVVLGGVGATLSALLAALLVPTMLTFRVADLATHNEGKVTGSGRVAAGDD